MIFLLVAAGAAGAALNSVAGGGSFVALPALLYAGLPPVAANATGALIWTPASISSAIAYRRDITVRGPMLAVLAAVSFAGSVIGALLLLRTSDTSFMRLLPWLMLLAAATFTFGDWLVVRAGRRASAAAVVLQFAIAVYGGYFGGGMGIMMLAALSIAGLRDIHEMNGLKSILGGVINSVALAAFVVHRAVVWGPGLVMMAAGIAGGYGGAAVARRIDRRVVRVFVVVVGWGMTIYFFWR